MSTQHHSQALPGVSLCVNFCEVALPQANAQQLEALLAETCQQAGFPYCERVYVGSYFCENYFCALDDSFHEAVRELCSRFDLRATLVVPVIGQAFQDRAWQCIDEVLERFGNTYDELVANDVACYLELAKCTSMRIGLGRLFSKEVRDARIPHLMERPAQPRLSAEARECLLAQENRNLGMRRPLVELDPTANVVDVSGIMNDAVSAEIALHLPFCFATTGRNCGAASIDEPIDQKFVIGRGCGRHCLRMAQGYLTDGNVRYIKHGRTFYYSNPGCRIAGTNAWRVVYTAAHPSMGLVP